MFRNNLKITLRTIRKYRSYSIINIAGLAIGMAVFMLILLYVQNELAYDRFHERAKRIQRVAIDLSFMGQEYATATTAPPTAAALINEFPEVEQAVRLDITGPVLISYDDQRFYEERFMWADSNVFDVFSFPFIKGHPKKALAQPNTVVVTEATAKKYFGDADPMGKVLRFNNNTNYEVTGVLQDTPNNSQFEFDLLASFVSLKAANEQVWLNMSCYTYLLLRDGNQPADLEAKLPQLTTKYIFPQLQQMMGEEMYEKTAAAGLRWDLYLETFTDIYLHSTLDDQIGATGNVRYLYVFSSIAAFILVIACINFMNLATARSTKRAKEIGLRKVMGSGRRQLIRQFLLESVLMSFAALMVALVLIHLALPGFSNMAGKPLVLDGRSIVFLFGISLVTGLVAGVYPAFSLSHYQPVDVLKGNVRGGDSRSLFRSSLVVFQFVVSIILLIGTVIVYKQLHYMRNKDLGFTDEQVVVIPIKNEETKHHFDSIQDELTRNSDVMHVAGSNGLPGRAYYNTIFRKEGVPDDESFTALQLNVTHDFAKTLELRMLAGRDFSRAYATDTDAIIINEATARQAGWDVETAIGKRLVRPGADRDGNEFGGHTIIGVLQDFHFESLHQSIRPVIMGLDPQNINTISVRIRPDNIPTTLTLLEKQHQAYEPSHPFSYYFLDEDFGRLYEQDRKFGRICGSFTLLAILIACLGLFGLASFITEQRTKEIGVRKVLGASVGGIVVLLSREYFYLVSIAAVIAFPIAYYAMSRWIEAFAYRTSLSWGIFVLAGLATLLVAWLTVGYRSIRAAVADPVKSLRYE